MKKLGILFASVFLLGLVFQSCNNGKTYAEIKEEGTGFYDQCG